MQRLLERGCSAAFQPLATSMVRPRQKRKEVRWLLGSGPRPFAAPPCRMEARPEEEREEEQEEEGQPLGSGSS